jgi:hypothetical protein
MVAHLPLRLTLALGSIGAFTALIAPGAGARSAGEHLTVAPAHGRPATTFSVTFVRPASSQRGENVILFHPPHPSCTQRHPIGNADNIYTPGESSAPAARRLTWRFGPHVRDHISANGDFAIRLRYFATPDGKAGTPLAKWCLGLWEGRLGWSPYNESIQGYGRPIIYARFSFRVTRPEG